MKELVLVRHGEAEHMVKGISGGWTDLPLTDRGKKQIEITANRLKELFESRIEIIYTSDLMRASESAKIIKGKLEVQEVLFTLFLNVLPHALKIAQAKGFISCRG